MTSKKRILVVEDTPDAILLVTATLGKMYDLIIAKNLVQARKELTTGTADLVLLDASLPDGDGFSFCSWLLGDKRYKEIPIVFLTSRSEPEEEEHALNLGARAYLTKPLKPAILRAKLAEILTPAL